MGYNSLAVVVFGTYFLSMAAIIIGVAAFAPAEVFWAIIAVFLIILLVHPSVKSEMPTSDRPLTDAEVKLRIVQELREHMECYPHSDGDCDEDCPVPELLKKVVGSQ